VKKKRNIKNECVQVNDTDNDDNDDTVVFKKIENIKAVIFTKRERGETTTMEL